MRHRSWRYLHSWQARYMQGDWALLSHTVNAVYEVQIAQHLNLSDSARSAAKWIKLAESVIASGTGMLVLKRLACLQSVLARGLHALLPPIEVIKGSYCNANPENSREWEVRCIHTH